MQKERLKNKFHWRTKILSKKNNNESETGFVDKSERQNSFIFLSSIRKSINKNYTEIVEDGESCKFGDDIDNPIDFRSLDMNDEKEEFRRHVGALFLKRAKNFKRDKKAWCCTILLPTILALFGLLSMKYMYLDRNMEPLELSRNDYNVNIKNEDKEGNHV